jgi:ADP-heptose:LPS heptosyltransferase
VNFADTAALVSNLDLVISVDTAVAHLAGALGKPCWLLLPEYKTDWRWLNERTDTPWYPCVMRLFRQTIMGDWSDVISEVVLSLEQFRDIKV